MHVEPMTPATKYLAPLKPGYQASIEVRHTVPASEVRTHILDLFAAGIDRTRLSALSGVHRSEISAILAFDTNGMPRRRFVDGNIAGALMLVHSDITNLDPSTKMLAIGAQRRVQGLARMGHSIPSIAAWLATTPATLERLLAPTTQVITVRAHRSIAKMFSTHWITGPERKDPDTIARAVESGWQSPLAWDDIDLDLAPAAVTLHAISEEDTIDEIAVDLALTGAFVMLSPAERRIVVGKAHEQRLSDDAIAALTGIPVSTVWTIRQELGLDPWNADDAAIELAAIA